MAKGAPKGKGKAAKGPVVGYGQEGKAFHNQKNYNKSVEGNRHAKNPALSKKPVGYGKEGDAFFSKGAMKVAKGNSLQSKGGTPGQGHPAPPHVPMPGHPSQNPTHVHGPAATGNIQPVRGNGPKPPPGAGAPKKGGGSGTVARPPMKGLPGRTAGGGGRL